MHIQDFERPRLGRPGGSSDPPAFSTYENMASGWLSRRRKDTCGGDTAAMPWLLPVSNSGIFSTASLHNGDVAVRSIERLAVVRMTVARMAVARPTVGGRGWMWRTWLRWRLCGGRLRTAATYIFSKSCVFFCRIFSPFFLLFFSEQIFCAVIFTVFYCYVASDPTSDWSDHFNVCLEWSLFNRLVKNGMRLQSGLFLYFFFFFRLRSPNHGWLDRSPSNALILCAFIGLPIT